MKPMGRRGFLTASTALGIGAGLSTHAIVSEVNENETSDKTSDISRRDQDLSFIGTEETFTTPTLLKLNSINQDHIDFLEEIGLSDLGQRRIGDMDKGDSTFKSSLLIHPPCKMSLGKGASTLPIVSTGNL